MKPKKLVILGTGGTSQDLVDIVGDINKAHPEPLYELVGFLDDTPATWGTSCRNLDVLGPLASATDHRDTYFVNGIGSVQNFYLKKEILEKTLIPEGRFVTLIHPTASVSPTATLGVGTVLHPYVVVEGDVSLGKHVMITPHTCIGHNASIGSYSTISIQVGVIGHVNIGQSCYLGANCSVLKDVGHGSLIGMGSVVINEVPPNQVVVGNPGRVLRQVC